VFKTVVQSKVDKCDRCDVQYKYHSPEELVSLTVLRFYRHKSTKPKSILQIVIGEFSFFGYTVKPFSFFYFYTSSFSSVAFYRLKVCTNLRVFERQCINVKPSEESRLNLSLFRRRSAEN